MSVNGTQVIICCGGGTDSTSLIDYYLGKGLQVQGIHFDYGQPALRGERRAIESISAYYRVSILQSELHPRLASNLLDEYPGRNALFVILASQFLERKTGLIGLGIHAGTPYYDCTPGFVNQIQGLLDGYFGGSIALDAPFLNLQKRDIYAYCKQRHVPVDLTYSCQRNPDVPCGECLSCLDRRIYASMA